MSRSCEQIADALGVWLDGELGPAESEEIGRHVATCPVCREARLRLQRLDGELRSGLKSRAADLPWPDFWAGVERKLAAERAPEDRRWRRWLPRQPASRRLAWAIPLAVVGAVAVLAAGRYYLGWQRPRNHSNLAAVESIDAHGFNLALFREAETKTTVIWLFLSEGEDETASEVPVADISR